jgi:RNA polymerase sigma factor (sigma-70 family)
MNKDLESTATVLEQVREGAPGARDRLVRRYLPPLQRWARGRIPAGARSCVDTDDLVQLTLMRALDKVKEFEPRHPGAFLAYLRRILQNKVLDELRRQRRRPELASLPAEVLQPHTSALEHLIGKEQLQSYERALAALSPEQQEAVILRIECGCSWQEVARSLGSPSANAARMVVTRALVKLVEQMDAD